MNSTLETALEYRTKNLSIIPVRTDKKPLLKWEIFQKRKAEPEEIKSWFDRWPDANIGIVTGKVSGIDVIDVDTSEGEELLAEALGTDVATFNPPIARTPRGGKHLYVAATGERNKTGFIKGVDYRGEGGFVVVPPSQGANGKAYEWMQKRGIIEMTPPACPPAILSLINSFPLYRGVVNKSAGPLQTITSATNHNIDFTQGRRDETLFHIANHLVKSGMPLQEIEAILSALALNVCNPPFPEKELSLKIQSALKRAQRKERNLAAEIQEWLTITNHYITVTECDRELQIITAEQKNHRRVIFHRLCKKGILEPDQNRPGYFRKVDTDVEPVNFLTAPTDEFPIKWPLGIHDYCIIYPGNIIVVAGSKSAGKTAFLLNVVKLNQDRHEVVYLNSEMGDTEFRKRLELFEDMKLKDWRFKPYHRSKDFSDLITPDRKIFIIDFMEVTTDFWKVAQYIQDIHCKLKEGICIIALQKSDSKDTGRGGDFSKEKARIYLSLDYLPEQKLNSIKITDAKAWRRDTNPRGLCRHYKLVQGSKYMPTTEWRD